METEHVRGSWNSHSLQPTMNFNVLSRTQSLSSSLGQIRLPTAELPPTEMSHHWSYLSRCNSLPQTSLSASSISTRRGFTHDLSVPTNLAFRAPQTSELSPADVCPRRTVKDDTGCTLQPISLYTNQTLTAEPNMTYYLPTPPEELDCINWENAGQQLHGGFHNHAATGDVSPGCVQSAPEQSIAPLPSNLLQDVHTQTIRSQMLQCPEWLIQACQVLVSKLSTPGADLDNIELVSQILPSQAQDLRSKPTFELLHDLLQQMRSTTVYMTITHAVTQSRVRREFPRSPPATPMRPNEDGYFAFQNVFTNASVVPTYHGSIETPRLQNPPMIHHVMAPSKANIVVLERYIPPNNAEEINDFFNANSGKSYLADRLPELSRRNGTLLLIYPTKQGGHTFASEYLAPVLDPILRQQAVLHGLNTYAAENIGRLTTVDSMLDFEEMNVRVKHFCERMTEMSNQRSSRSAYSVVHSSTGQIVVDHPTWMSWFIEQEQERIKQNLTDYQVRSAGKLSTSSEVQLQFSREGDSREVDEPSISGMTRDIIDSLRKSVHRSLDVGIEVACFVIRRNDIL